MSILIGRSADPNRPGVYCRADLIEKWRSTCDRAACAPNIPVQERQWTDRQDEVPSVATDAFDSISSGLAEHGPEASGNILR